MRSCTVFVLLFTHHYPARCFDYVTENGVNSNVFVQLQVIKKRSKDYAQTVSRRSKVYHRSASEV